MPSTAKLVPETVTKGEDHLPLCLWDVREGTAETAERSEKSERAKATREYMPVQVGVEAPGSKGRHFSPFSNANGRGPENRSHESLEGADRPT